MHTTRWLPRWTDFPLAGILLFGLPPHDTTILDTFTQSQPLVDLPDPASLGVRPTLLRTLPYPRSPGVGENSPRQATTRFCCSWQQPTAKTRVCICSVFLSCHHLRLLLRPFKTSPTYDHYFVIFLFPPFFVQSAQMGQSPSTKTRARRLLALLRGLQKKDWPIPPPMVFAVKHLLLQNSHCSIVQIKINPGEDQGCNLDHHLLPTFFFSQLDSQGLTDISSGGVDPSWILQYILRSLSASSAGGPRQKEHPTLFRWYSKPRHRYYYIFALLRHKMPRNKVYTIQELLSLQDHQVCRNVQALAANPEIGNYHHPN